MLAAGVSAFDLIYRRWAHLPGSPKLPFTLGEDVVGIVHQRVPEATTFEAGQMVAGGNRVLGVGGGYAEYLCLPEYLSSLPSQAESIPPRRSVWSSTTSPPTNISTTSVASGAVSASWCTASSRWKRHRSVRAGQAAGLEDVSGTASRDQHDLVLSLGATPIDYRTEDFVACIEALTGDGVDVVIDPIGGAKHLWRSYRTLRLGGRLVWLGSAAVDEQGLRVAPFSMAMAFVLGFVPYGERVPRCPTMDKHAEAHPDWFHATLTELLDSLATGQLEPVIAERIPLGEAAKAHELLERGGHTGKVVLTTNAYQKA